MAGVYNVVLHNLPLTVVKPDQWARCTSTTIRITTKADELLIANYLINIEQAESA